MKYKKCAIFSGMMVLLVILASHKNYDFSIKCQIQSYVLSLIVTYFVFLLLSASLAMVINFFRQRKLPYPDLREQQLSNKKPKKEQASGTETVQKAGVPEELMPVVSKLLEAPARWSQYVEQLKHSTTPEMFFDAYDSFMDYANELYHANELYKKYCGNSAIDSDCEKNICELVKGGCLLSELDSFIDRSAEETVMYMHSLESGLVQKRIDAQEWHDSFEPYLSRMPKNAIEHLHTKYGVILMEIEQGNSANL